jgi:curved DNA-binding protein CbpA
MKKNGPDAYDVLHISPTATQGEVGRAYRALMRSRHPDTQPPGEHNAAQGSPKLHDVMDAYAILGNPEKRAAYDRDHPQASTPAKPPQQRNGTLVRTPRPLLPGASLLIGPVLREPLAGRSPAMPAWQGSYPLPGYTLIWRIPR